MCGCKNWLLEQKGREQGARGAGRGAWSRAHGVFQNRNGERENG